MPTSTPVVNCGNCGSELDEDVSSGVEYRQSCPHCGSLTRRVSITVSDTIHVHSKMKVAARHGNRGRPFLEQIIGDDLYGKTGKWMIRQMIIDRAKDWYRETVTDPETGEVVHHSEEPLTQHRGHGSSKKRKES